DFAPLRFVPKGKGVVLGLISSKTPALETIDSLQRRVEEATKDIASERLAISPQGGFASSAGGNPLTEAQERPKLRLAVDPGRATWRWRLEQGDGGPGGADARNASNNSFFCASPAISNSCPAETGKIDRLIASIQDQFCDCSAAPWGMHQTMSGKTRHEIEIVE